MKIRIDDERCVGHGRCYALAPELFEPDELGNGDVIGDGRVSPEHVAAGERAAANCPEKAITLHEENPDG